MKYTVKVARLTADRLVSTGKLESSQGVIEIGAFPGFGRVALGAVLSESPLVGVMLCVAGIAILRGAPEYIIQVARFTVDRLVSTCKLESSQGVIEISAFPGFGRVALGAVLSESPHVRVIFAVAYGAGLRCGLQFADRTSAWVALAALYRCVFPPQWKVLLVVVERLPIRIQTVVTGQTFAPKRS